jgi:hypothetical protein
MPTKESNRIMNVLFKNENSSWRKLIDGKKIVHAAEETKQTSTNQKINHITIQGFSVTPSLPPPKALEWLTS